MIGVSYQATFYNKITQRHIVNTVNSVENEAIQPKFIMRSMLSLDYLF